MLGLDLFNLFLELILELSSLLGIALLLSKRNFQVKPLLQILSYLEFSFRLFIHQLFHLTFSCVN